MLICSGELYIATNFTVNGRPFLCAFLCDGNAAGAFLNTAF